MKILFLSLIFLSDFIGIKNCLSQWQVCEGIDTISTVSINCFTTSGNNFFAGAQYGIYSSSNYGQNWTRIGLNNRFVISITTLGNNIFAGTGDGVFVSSNNGQNWIQTSLNDKVVTSLIISENNIFAATNIGIYASSNSGQNWSQTSLINQSVTTLVASGNKFFAGTEKNGVFFSNNGGQNWIQTSLNDIDVYSLAVSGNNVYAGVQVIGVLFSTNNGQNWIQTGLNNESVYAISILGSNILAAPGTGISYSSNNGQTWVERNEGFSFVPAIYSLFIFNNYIFAGGYSVWRRPLQDIISVHNISTEIPYVFSLSQNYPNPFNPSTKIKFDITENGFTTLKVYDLTGKEVQTLVNEELRSGVYEATFDGVLLTSGVYFYRLSSCEYSETKRMLLMK